MSDRHQPEVAAPIDDFRERTESSDTVQCWSVWWAMGTGQDRIAWQGIHNVEAAQQ